MKITRIRHLWPEPAGFELERKNGAGEYIFLHFLNSVDIVHNGETIVTKPDTCIIYSPDEPQWFKSHCPLTHNWMHLSGDVGYALSQYGLSLNTLYTVGDGDFITVILRELEMEYNSEKKYYDSLSNIKLQELFIKISRSTSSNNTFGISPEITQKFDALRSEMLSNLQKDWFVPEMAQKVFLSEPYFYLLYKRIYGISPTQDLILARVDKAKRLLQQNFKVSEVAAMTGYTSEYHFINQFRKTEGMSPGKYASSLKAAVNPKQNKTE